MSSTNQNLLHPSTGPSWGDGGREHIPCAHTSFTDLEIPWEARRGQGGFGSKVKEAEQEHSPNFGKPGSGEHQGRLQGQDGIKEGSLEGKAQLASAEENSGREDERKGRRQEKQDEEGAGKEINRAQGQSRTRERSRLQRSLESEWGGVKRSLWSCQKTSME